MEKIRRISLFAISCLLCACVGAFAVSVSADSGVSEKTVQYEYALLGDVYTIESGLISATKPNGSIISASEGTVFLDWAQGSYKFEYGKKIVDLKVYESAPQDEVTLSGEIPNDSVAGISSEFPSCNVKSGIVRTDGAPEVGTYAVSASFIKNGETVYTAKNAEETIKFAPEIGGIWQISYTYTDVFGVVRSTDYTFSVADKKIILTDLSGSYHIGEKVSFSGTYGYFKGEKHEVKVSVNTPSKKTENPSGSYVFGEAGSYSFTFSSLIDGERIEKQVLVNVRVSLSSFITDKTGLIGGDEFTNHSNITGEGASEKGILFDMSATEASFSYNGVIDLKKLEKTTPVISFTTNNSHGGTLSCIEVTLTDAYDSTNTVTVRFAKNGDTTETKMSYDNTLVRASFGSVSTAFNNYYPLKTDAVAWDTRFDTFWLSPANDNPDKNYEAAKSLYTMNFSFDTETNEIYSYGNFSRIGRPDGNESGVKWWKIAELSSSSLPVQFKGFTTGEVYLSLKTVSGKGDIVVNSIGGKTIDVSASDYEDSSSILFGSFIGDIPAVKGREYSVPYYGGKYISDIVVYAEIGSERTRINGGAFIPEKSGNYTLIYEGVNSFGKKVSRKIGFACVDSQIPIEIVYDDAVPKIGEVYTVTNPVFGGGHGKISFEIIVNGEIVSVGDKIAVAEDRLEIVIRATDELGFSAEKTFVTEADKDVLIFDVEFPRTATSGAEFTFPNATITYCETSEILSYEIYFDGEKVTGNKIVLTSDKTSAEVEYRTSLGSETFTLYLKDAATETGKDALIFKGDAVTTDEGTAITLSSENAVASLPYRLSPNGLYFDFFVLEEKMNFNAVTLKLTDKNGTSVTFTVGDILSASPQLYINGDSISSAAITKRSQTFSSGASEKYAGKNYYAFSIAYENFYKATLNGSAIQSYVTKDSRGVAFEGFDGGVYADISVEEISGSLAEIVITRIGNQLFYSSGFAFGDVTGPSVYSPAFRPGNSNVEKGYVLDVSGLKAYDVLKGDSAVSVTLTLADGSKAYENVSPENAQSYTLSSIGIYLLKITARDSGGAVTNITCRFAVDDEEVPVLTVAGEIAKTVKTGETIDLAAASAADESAVTVKIYVFRPDGKIDFIYESDANFAGGKYLVSGSGVHRIVYSAEDEYGNTVTVSYPVNAEER